MSEAVKFLEGQASPTDWIILMQDGQPYVIPAHDIREHDVSGSCWCDPFEEDGIIVHQSMDQRESYERGRKKQ